MGRGLAVSEVGREGVRNREKEIVEGIRFCMIMYQLGKFTVLAAIIDEGVSGRSITMDYFPTVDVFRTCFTALCFELAQTSYAGKRLVAWVLTFLQSGTNKLNESATATWMLTLGVSTTSSYDFPLSDQIIELWAQLPHSRRT